MGDGPMTATYPRSDGMVKEDTICPKHPEKRLENACPPHVDPEKQRTSVDTGRQEHQVLVHYRTKLGRLCHLAQHCTPRVRSSVRIYLAILTFMAVIALTHVVRQTDLAVAFTAVNSSTVQINATSTSKAQPRIMILQHFSPHASPRFPMPEGLAESSRLSHEQYAALWQYDYRADERQLVMPVRDGEDVVTETATQSFNKLYAVMLAVMEEMDKPAHERAEWILATDADSIIFNPLVPLHLLLPPRHPRVPHAEAEISQTGDHEPPPAAPPPLILAAQDFNGFNAGVMMFRLPPDDPDLLLSILGEVLAHRALAFDAEGVWHSDQACWGRVLRAHPDVAERFWQVPQMWWNAYYPDLGEEARFAVEQDREVREDDPGWTPTVQIHLPGGYKYSEPWREVFDLSQRVHADLDRHAQVRNTTMGEVVRSMKTYGRTESIGRAFWGNATAGIDNMAWNDF